jgi:chloride channel protein, CIC family
VSRIRTGDKNTIYRSQIPDRASSPAHRVRMSFPLLSCLLVRDALTRCDTVLGYLPAKSVSLYFDRNASSALVLLDEDARFAGVVSSEKVNVLLPDQLEKTAIKNLLENDPVTLNPTDTLDTALEQLSARGISWAPVVESGRLMGKLTVKDSIAAYRNALERSVRRTNALPRSIGLFEVRLHSSSPLAGKTLRESGFPPDTLVVSISRQGDAIFPHADSRLAAGDVLILAADPASEAAINTFLGEPTKTVQRH